MIGRPQVFLQHAVQHAVQVAVTLADVLAGEALAAHSDFLQHSPRRGVANEVERVHAVLAQSLEGKSRNGGGGPGAIAATPEWSANPKTETGAVVVGLEGETDGAQQLTVVLPGDREIERAAGIEVGLMPSDPIDGMVGPVRMGDQECHCRNAGIVGEAGDRVRVFEREGTENQPAGLDRGAMCHLVDIPGLLESVRDVQRGGEASGGA